MTKQVIIYFMSNRKTKVTRWDSGSQTEIESPEAVENFLDAYEALCRKHGRSLAHEDYHGAFIVEPFDERNIKWVRGATLRLTRRG